MREKGICTQWEWRTFVVVARENGGVVMKLVRNKGDWGWLRHRLVAILFQTEGEKGRDRSGRLDVRGGGFLAGCRQSRKGEQGVRFTLLRIWPLRMARVR